MSEPQYHENPPSCEHAESRLVRRTNRNGAQVAVTQCRRCGRSLGQTPRARLAQPMASLPAWDEDIVESWDAVCQNYWERRRDWYETQRDAADREWWRRYNEHLNSEKWAALRRKVLARCRGICEGCGERPAAHIHHLDYARLGDEMLFDLAAVCLPCHERIHPHMREGAT